MCRAAGVQDHRQPGQPEDQPPEFEEITGAAVVTFRVPVAQGAGEWAESRPGSRPDSEPEFDGLSLEERIVTTLRDGPLAKSITLVSAMKSSSSRPGAHSAAVVRSL